LQWQDTNQRGSFFYRALNGGHYTGADLTETALEATRKHFEVLGLKGKFQKENAEQLTMADAGRLLFA
jgi:ubiquinone/menaquinone biosynthesis C-methylase UbiE